MEKVIVFLSIVFGTWQGPQLEFNPTLGVPRPLSPNNEVVGEGFLQMIECAKTLQ